MTKHPMLYAWVISLALAPLALLSDDDRGETIDMTTASSLDDGPAWVSLLSEPTS